MIFEPGRKMRLDIHTPTSAIDILPTLLHLTGQPAVDWAEGFVLPPFLDSYPNNRTIFVLDAKTNGKYAPLSVATSALIKEQYKLMYFFGYKELDGEERVELYDLNNDPDELNDLYTTKRETSGELLNELKAKIAEVNGPYQ
jgi:arylsulfatase A-like enzyme